jgi:NHL repeat/Beta-propeller repeat
MKKLLPILTGSVLAVSLFLIGCVKSAAPAPPVTPPDSTGTTTKPPAPKTWYVSTVAGSGTAGFADGDSTLAEFSNAQCIAIDQQGNLFVSDLGNQRIRKITPGRQVTTWTDDSIASLSLTSNINPVFGNIFGIVIDSKSNVYDIDYDLIRQFSSPSTGTVFAGQMLIGYKDSIGTYADFNIINRLAIDRQDNIYVPDYDMSNVSHIRKITPAGVVSTLSLQDNTGLPGNSDGSDWYLYSIAVDSSGNIYVSGNGNMMIKKITPQGVVSVFAGSAIGLVDGKGTAAMFGSVSDLACDAAGNVWVADGMNNAIREVTPDGTVTTIAGGGGLSFADGPAKQAFFHYPSGIAVAKDGTVYVVDNGNNRIRKIYQQ